MTTSPLAYFWGDDELVGRARRRPTSQAALAAESGAPAGALGRCAATHDARRGAGRRARTSASRPPVMFGGGTLAVVTDVGRRWPRHDRAPRRAHRDARPLAPGNAPGRSSRPAKIGRQGTVAQAALADAVAAAGGGSCAVRRPRRPAASTGWIEAEARERGLDARPGRREGAAPSGSAASSRQGDVERRYQTRTAARWSSTSSRSTATAGTITVDDVRALVAEAVPGSVWAFSDAVGERQAGPALDLPRAAARRHPEPVLIDRPPPSDPRAARDRATGWRRRALPGRVAQAMGITSEYRAQNAGGPGAALDDRRSCTARSTACSSSTRWSRARRAPVRTRRSVAWRSRCG